MEANKSSKEKNLYFERAIFVLGGKTKEVTEENKSNDKKQIKSHSQQLKLQTSGLSRCLSADGDSVIDSVGKVVTVFQAVLIGSMALGNASPNLVAVGQARSSLQKCLEVIDRPSAMQEGEDGGGEQPQKCFGKIEMKNITFRCVPHRLPKCMCVCVCVCVRMQT